MSELFSKAIQSTKQSISRAWRITQITANVAAYASLFLVALTAWEVAHGKIVKFDGVAHAEMPFGNPQQAMIAQLPADQVLPATFTMPETKPAKVADEPRPGHNPFYKAQ